MEYPRLLHTVRHLRPGYVYGLQLDNFRKLKEFGWQGFRKINLWRQDKGQQNCVASFLNTVEKGGPSTISFKEIEEITRISFNAVEMLESLDAISSADCLV